MKSAQSSIYGVALFFLGLFLTGFCLHRRGKPYGVILFNMHKFIGLGTAIYLGVMVYQINQQVPLISLEIAAVGITAAFFIITVIAGGLLNTDVTGQKTLLTIHFVFPYLAVIATAITFYFLYR